MVISPPPPDPINQESIAMAVSGAGSLIQEIIVAASSMLYAFQQVAFGGGGGVGDDHQMPHHHNDHHHQQQQQHLIQRVIFSSSETSHCTIAPTASISTCSVVVADRKDFKKAASPSRTRTASDIIELDAADLLAKYTHYCQVCGKGFKRDANLRMHMRAHGDEYKTNAALSNPSKGGGGAPIATYKEYTSTAAAANGNSSSSTTPGKYSCPQEGCRWNKKHAKFQPLKSMICVKNHYKRSHCPKMYVCNRCNLKQFSVLSDLRTHEKHCGDLKWQCSCGTTFSRKDKLMGHVSLFAGHTPVFGCLGKQGNVQDQYINGCIFR